MAPGAAVAGLCPHAPLQPPGSARLGQPLGSGVRFHPLRGGGGAGRVPAAGPGPRRGPHSWTQQGARGGGPRRHLTVHMFCRDPRLGQQEDGAWLASGLVTVLAAEGRHHTARRPPATPQSGEGHPATASGARRRAWLLLPGPVPADRRDPGHVPHRSRQGGRQGAAGRVSQRGRLRDKRLPPGPGQPSARSPSSLRGQLGSASGRPGYGGPDGPGAGLQHAGS